MDPALLSPDPIRSLTTEFCGAFPERAAGGAGERAAAEWVAARMRAAGLHDVEITDVAFDLSVAGACEARGDGGRALTVRPLLGVPSCDLTLPVLDVGMGTAADYERLRAQGAPLAGTAHLAWRGAQGPGTDEMDRLAKHHWAREHGAAAFVHAMDVAEPPEDARLPEGADRPPPLEGGLPAPDRQLPSVSLAAPGAEGLRELTLRIDASERAMTAPLVTARLPGRTDEEVVLGAQLDAVEWARYGAAYDNGAGIALLLLIAEALAKGPAPRRTLVLCAYGAEEAGTVTSRYHAGEYAGEPERVAAMVNLDSCTQKDGWVAVSSYGRGEFGAGSFDMDGPYGGNADTAHEGSLARALLRHLEVAGYPPDRAYLPRRTEWTSDHYPYAILGIPSVWAFKKPAIFHCEYDTLGMMDWDDASHLGRATAALIAELLA